MSKFFNLLSSPTIVRQGNCGGTKGRAEVFTMKPTDLTSDVQNVESLSFGQRAHL